MEQVEKPVELGLAKIREMSCYNLAIPAERQRAREDLSRYDRKVVDAVFMRCIGE